GSADAADGPAARGPGPRARLLRRLAVQHGLDLLGHRAGRARGLGRLRLAPLADRRHAHANHTRRDVVRGVAVSAKLKDGCARLEPPLRELRLQLLQDDVAAVLEQRILLEARDLDALHAL